MKQQHTQDTPPMSSERETQILDGLRWADCLLASFGMQPLQLDVAALVTLRTVEWGDDDMTLRDLRRILSTVETTPALRTVA